MPGIGGNLSGCGGDQTSSLKGFHLLTAIILTEKYSTLRRKKCDHITQLIFLQ